MVVAAPYKMIGNTYGRRRHFVVSALQRFFLWEHASGARYFFPKKRIFVVFSQRKKSRQIAKSSTVHRIEKKTMTIRVAKSAINGGIRAREERLTVLACLLYGREKKNGRIFRKYHHGANVTLINEPRSFYPYCPAVVRCTRFTRARLLVHVYIHTHSYGAQVHVNVGTRYVR